MNKLHVVLLNFYSPCFQDDNKILLGLLLAHFLWCKCVFSGIYLHAAQENNYSRLNIVLKALVNMHEMMMPCFTQILIKTYILYASNQQNALASECSAARRVYVVCYILANILEISHANRKWLGRINCTVYNRLRVQYCALKAVHRSNNRFIS
jgi:hypothetical protein